MDFGVKTFYHYSGIYSHKFAFFLTSLDFSKNFGKIGIIKYNMVKSSANDEMSLFLPTSMSYLCSLTETARLPDIIQMCRRIERLCLSPCHANHWRIRAYKLRRLCSDQSVHVPHESSHVYCYSEFIGHYRNFPRWAEGIVLTQYKKHQMNEKKWVLL